jgi:hypothetical protein
MHLCKVAAFVPLKRAKLNKINVSLLKPPLMSVSVGYDMYIMSITELKKFFINLDQNIDPQKISSSIHYRGAKLVYVACKSVKEMSL